MHISVLLQESIDNLNLKEDSIIVDATLGRAGHSSEILKRIPKGKLIAFDQDDEAINASDEKLSKIVSNYTIIKSNFKNMKQELAKLNITKVDGILLDLGVSSYQLDEKNRGFSYLGENELDMRMDKTQNLTAKDVVNTYSEENLAKIIYEYGEERFSRQIARNICEYRKQKDDSYSRSF